MEKSGDLSGPAGVCRNLSGPAGICGHLWGSVGICGDLHGSAWICPASHSETLCNLVVGPASSPVLQPLAPGKILSRTGRTKIRSPSWSYPQDGRTAPLRTLLSQKRKRKRKFRRARSTQSGTNRDGNAHYAIDFRERRTSFLFLNHSLFLGPPPPLGIDSYLGKCFVGNFFDNFFILEYLYHAREFREAPIRWIASGDYFR